MSAPAIKRSYPDTEESIELQVLGGTLRFGSATELNTYVEDTSANTPTRRSRMVERSNKQINDAKAPVGNGVEI
jgi:hypothetical protein